MTIIPIPSFNPSTTIEYDLSQAVHVRMIIFDLLGRQIRTLVDTDHESGHFQVSWDGTNDHHQLVTAGIYLCRMEAEEFVKVIKIAFIK